MRLKRYIHESKMGKLPQKIERTAYLRDDPAMLKWKMVNPDLADDRVNYKTIENIACKELQRLKKTKTIDFYDDAFDVNGIFGVGNNEGDRAYEATVKLNSYDVLSFMKKLRQFKFKIKG